MNSNEINRQESLDDNYNNLRPFCREEESLLKNRQLHKNHAKMV